MAKVSGALAWFNLIRADSPPSLLNIQLCVISYSISDMRLNIVNEIAMLLWQRYPVKIRNPLFGHV